MLVVEIGSFSGNGSFLNVFLVASVGVDFLESSSVWLLSLRGNG